MCVQSEAKNTGVMRCVLSFTLPHQGDCVGLVSFAQARLTEKV